MISEKPVAEHYRHRENLHVSRQTGQIGTETLALIEFCNFAEFVFARRKSQTSKFSTMREGVTDFGSPPGRYPDASG